MLYTKLFAQIAVIILLFAVISANVDLDFNIYTKTQTVLEKMSALAKKYPNIIKEHSILEIKTLKDTYSKDGTTLFKYFDIGNNIDKPGVTKIFLMSGEHPREMIAVEAMYNFVHDMAKNQDLYRTILDKLHIRLVLVANPYSRLKVEKGEYCRRLNPNNVDINRNWDIHWGKNIQMGEENPGKKPFSEPETQFLKHLIEDMKPLVFLTLHSGVYGLYMPHAFVREEAKKNGKEMKDILTEIKQKFCPMCQLGAPSVNIGYQSSGTCLDYTYEKMNIPYSFVWEIYTDEVSNKDLENYRMKHRHSPDFGIKAVITKKKSFRFMQSESVSMMAKAWSKMLTEDKMKFLNKRKFTRNENQFCMSLFNPLDKLGVKFIKVNWTKAIKFFLEKFEGK